MIVENLSRSLFYRKVNLVARFTFEFRRVSTRLATRFDPRIGPRIDEQVDRNKLLPFRKKKKIYIYIYDTKN